MTSAKSGTRLALYEGMLSRIATFLGMLMVLAGVFACGPKATNAALTTAAVLACFPETLEGGTLAEKGYGDPGGPGVETTDEVVPEHLLGPDPFARKTPQ